jgi:hypothetical protein
MKIYQLTQYSKKQTNKKLALSLKINTIKKIKNIHPGEILLEEFLIPLEITAYSLSKEISIPQTCVLPFF